MRRMLESGGGERMKLIDKIMLQDKESIMKLIIEVACPSSVGYSKHLDCVNISCEDCWNQEVEEIESEEKEC